MGTQRTGALLSGVVETRDMRAAFRAGVILLAAVPMLAIARGGPPGGVHLPKRLLGEARLHHGPESLRLGLSSYETTTDDDGRRTIHLEYRDSRQGQIDLSFVTRSSLAVEESLIDLRVRSPAGDAKTVAGGSRCRLDLARLTDSKVTGRLSCSGLRAATGVPDATAVTLVFRGVKRW